jgi:hypothetical protein
VRGAPAPSSSTFLVEHYWPGVTVESFRAAAERVGEATAALAREGAAIRFLHSTVVPADEAAFCAFHADSAALVEEAYSRAGVSFERLVETVELPRPQPEAGT